MPSRDRDIDGLLFGRDGSRRFTQDSPIMPDVWLAYAAAPGKRLDLLLTPHREASAEILFDTLRRRLGAAKARSARLALNRSSVVASLSFDDLVGALLPLTPWWRKLAAAAPDSVGAARRRIAGKASPGKPGDGHSDPVMERHIERIVWLHDVLRCIDSRRRKPHLADTAANPQDIADRLLQRLGSGPEGDPDCLWRVNRNRQATLAVKYSIRTAKADAARRVFAVDCRNILWGVIDSGIDATHPAFAGRHAGTPPAGRFASRVRATYDFTRLRTLQSASKAQRKRLVKDWFGQLGAAYQPAPGHGFNDLLEGLEQSLKRGQMVDWGLVSPFLAVPHVAGVYAAPKDGHGTHVAGILAADWNYSRHEPPMQGMCPDLSLIDLRVFAADGTPGSDEFTIEAALQFVRYLNAYRSSMAVHGVNLSLSIPHDIRFYACGQTPVCEECNRLAGSGVVVVAAAGNAGHSGTEDGLHVAARDEYRMMSITDPGNAADVITVGATHREQPHVYGVSYFSSRGPTGDGRCKPDLVAPGEKIDAPDVGNGKRMRDGTSMAAPHVSGAAALLMARHAELIGQPARIKEILCRTATDLGRERYFQGHGLVDVLRAMQSM